ncbi:hypothetical protein [Arenimonas composti]|uniref:Uncharacterized protein n=1 Tax=Arenimonas composti TR7-09 = DSM 18010 TaxID=1121013 RepID=A0A091C0T7_9GAMM|nr:hypothetical protein [Arenimonas composti]KFN50245.1 hypothetical protein P873_07760 [Arenimonas composti TR7-09 = DSM 18010]
MKRLFLLLSALLALALCGCARADTLVGLSVRDLDSGHDLPAWPHDGRHWIEGRPGHRYAIVLQNLTGERVLAVVSVDGVNVISGETAGSAQSGYVLEPWQRLEVRGWRKNLGEVAEFHFTALPDSYAARTGRPGNVGVIGVAAFREKRPAPPVHIGQPTYPPPAPWYERDDVAAARAEAPRPAAPAQSAPSPADAGSRAREAESRAYAPYADEPRQQLGTGHGDRRRDAASVTQFERASRHPAQLASLYYDSAEVLVARRILPPRWPQPPGRPEPFPLGFAPDPR